MAHVITDIRQWTPLILRREIERPAADTTFIIHLPFEFGYSVEGEPVRREFIVPAGFRTDLSSVPKLARSVVSKVDLIEASVAHDYLYAGDDGRPVVPRQEADAVFLAFAAMAGDPWITRNIAWLAVRLFGGPVYRT